MLAMIPNDFDVALVFQDEDASLFAARRPDVWHFSGVGRDGSLGCLDVIDGHKMDDADLARLALAAVEREDQSSGQPVSGLKSH